VLGGQAAGRAAGMVQCSRRGGVPALEHGTCIHLSKSSLQSISYRNPQLFLPMQPTLAGPPALSAHWSRACVGPSAPVPAIESHTVASAMRAGSLAFAISCVLLALAVGSHGRLLEGRHLSQGEQEDM